MPVHDDKCPTLETRIVGALVILVLLLAVVSLYFFPTDTAQYFAWTIQPPTTAILVGEGYLAGAYFFARVITTRKWHTVQAGFLPITLFTLAMLGATLLHWGRFHQGTFIFYFWVVIYAVTPLLVPFLWWRNRPHTPSAPEAHELVFSLGLRRGLALLGSAGLLLGLSGFLFPAVYIAITPWKLSELTARIFAGWSLLASLTVVTSAQAGRWSAVRILLQAFGVGQVLTLLALPRIWGDLNFAHPMSYGFVAGLGLALTGLTAGYAWLERKSRLVQPSQGPASSPLPPHPGF